MGWEWVILLCNDETRYFLGNVLDLTVTDIAAIVVPAICMNIFQ